MPNQAAHLYSWAVPFHYNSYLHLGSSISCAVLTGPGGHEDAVLSDLFIALSSVSAHSNCSVNSIK